MAELEGLIAAASEKLTMGADENRSLQTSLDQLVEENSRLQRRVTDSEMAVLKRRLTQVSQLQAALKSAEAERGRLTAALAEANDKRQVETNTLSTRLEAMSSRAVTAEKLLAEVRQNLLSRTEDEQCRRAQGGRGDARAQYGGQEARTGETALQSKEKLLHEVEQFRAKLAERANTLLLNVRQRDKALSRAEEEIQALSSRVGQLEAETDAAAQKGRRNHGRAEGAIGERARGTHRGRRRAARRRG